MRRLHVCYISVTVRYEVCMYVSVCYKMCIIAYSVHVKVPGVTML